MDFELHCWWVGQVIPACAHNVTITQWDYYQRASRIYYIWPLKGLPPGRECKSNQALVLRLKCPFMFQQSLSALHICLFRIVVSRLCLKPQTDALCLWHAGSIREAWIIELIWVNTAKCFPNMPYRVCTINNVTNFIKGILYSCSLQCQIISHMNGRGRKSAGQNGASTNFQGLKMTQGVKTGK